MGAFSFLTVFAVLLYVAYSLNDELLKKLNNAKEQAVSVISSIAKEWDITHYPRFLKSCSMSKHSWELMKLKFTNKILQAWDGKNKQDLVISFLGSSVAAGHDSYFNQSYPLVVGSLLQSAFESLNINVISRNVALGNNPCMPYDICVKIFAGLDSDIVHWEQSYNCGGNPILEQFIRQAMTIPSQPLVVFSESATAHWNPKKCDPMPAAHTVTDDETELLKASPQTLVSDLNKDEFKRSWGVLHDLVKSYKGAGIQAFTHSAHEKYACLGPYIKDWEKGAAAWHPSVIAHRMRASQFAYFWLSALREAISDLIADASNRPADAIAREVAKHWGQAHSKSLAPPKFATLVPDNVTCFNDYEPRSMRESSLKNRVIKGLTPVELEKPKASTEVGGDWNSIIYENLVHVNLIKQGKAKGYLDYKHLMYADPKSNPLSILISLSKKGPVFICETPGIWGALPEGFKHLWEVGVTLYLTSIAEPDTPALKSRLTSSFTFKPEAAVKAEFVHEKKYEICVNLKEEVNAGTYVLTVVPNPSSDSKLILAWVVVP